MRARRCSLCLCALFAQVRMAASSSGKWTEKEQRLLEEGLVRSAAVCDPREKWQAVARVVGTRDARACAERYRECRGQAICQRELQAEEEEDEEGEEDEDADGGDVAAAEDGKDSGWRGGWREGRGWSGASWSGWEASGWSSGDWKWQGSGNGGASWEESKEDEEKLLASMDENQKRAHLMRKEVEANRERMRQREERQSEEKKRKEAKEKEAQEERDKKKREYVEEQERKYKERMEQEQRKKQQAEEERREAQRHLDKVNPGFAPKRAAAKPGKAAMPAHWAAKAAAERGQVQKQRKQEALDRQAAEVLANIGVSSLSKAKPSDDEEDDEDEDYSEPEPTAAPPRARPRRTRPPKSQVRHRRRRTSWPRRPKHQRRLLEPSRSPGRRRNSGGAAWTAIVRYRWRRWATFHSLPSGWRQPAQRASTTSMLDSWRTSFSAPATSSTR